MKQTIKSSLFITLLLGTAQPTAADNLLLHWRFDSPYEFGAIEPDASGQSVDGISTWARTRAGGGLRYAPGQGVFGGAGLLGQGEPDAHHGVRGSMQSLTTMKLGEQWTVSLWVKPSRDVSRYEDILSFVKRRENEWVSLFSLGQHGGRLRADFNLKGNIKTYQFFGTDTRLPADQWSHLLFVCGREEMRFYLNGERASQATTTQWYPKAEFFVRLSGRTGGPHNRLYGLYDDLRIYAGPLGPDQVADLADPQSDFYKNEKLPPVADAGLGYTAWLEKGEGRGPTASMQLQGGELLPERNGGAIAYRWRIVKQPNGANGQFADPSDPETTFTTNKAGAYEFTLTASNAGGSDTATARGAVFVRDEGPAQPKLFARKPEDVLLIDHVEPPHPNRAAVLEGKELPLVAHWSFDSIDNDTATATGLKPKDLKIDPTLVAPTEKGKYGGGLKVDISQRSQSKVLDFGSFAALTDEFTLSFWVYHENAPDRGEIFAAVGDDNQPYWKLWYRQVDPRSGHSNVYYKWYQARGQAPTDRQWVHYAITYSRIGDINKLFINGEQAAYLKRPLEEATGTPRLVFGVSGILDDVALYATTLNVDEVWALYNSPTGASGVKDRIPVDPYMSRGYQSEFIETYMPEPVFEYQNKGFAAERFGKKSPPPYTHPRLNLDLDNLPHIRKRTRITEQGNNNFAYITLYTRTIFGAELERYTPNVDFPEVRAVTNDADREQLRAELDAKFKMDPGQFTVKQLPRGESGEAAARGMLAYKALLTADEELARMLIDNMMKSAGLQKRALDVANARTSDWQHYYHDLMGRRLTPLMYDYLYGWMTPEERATIRETIARSTAAKWALGMYGVTALNAHTSNWEPWITGELMIAAESIYGEDGFDADVHAAAARALKLCSINTDDPDSGAHYEGMGKGTLGITQISVLSRNEADGQKSITSTSLYNHMTKFLLHIGLPWGNRRMMYDEKNGGLGRPKAHGILTMHYAYPDDPVINYLKRCITSGPEDYTGMQVRTFGQESWLIAAPYLQDWKGPADLQEHLKQAAEASGASLGYMSVFRGMMVGRSSWEADAAQLYFSPRSIRGGHSQIDRGYFIYNALGRQWIPFRGAEDNTVPDFNAVVTVDTLGQDVTPGRVLSYEGAGETQGATFDIMGADLTGCYRQIGGRWPTLNYSRLRGDPRRPWLDMPTGYLAAQLTGDRPLRSGILDVSTFDEENYKGAQPFDYAYRTAAFARGKRPYALIIDDIKKDDAMREYIWNAPLPEDIYIAESYELHDDTAILTDPTDKTEHLLVKVFGNSTPGKFVVEPVVPIAESRHRKEGMRLWENLKYRSKANSAKFRVLLYAYRDGDPLPKITGPTGSFTITIGQQKHSLQITERPSEISKVRLH